MAFTASQTIKYIYSNEKIIFNQVITNEVRAYNGTMGVFTSPSSGVYVFTWTIMTQNNLGRFYTYLSIDGTRQTLVAYADLSGVKSDFASSQSTMTETVRLSVGDLLSVHTSGCYFLYNSPYSAFSGWKL